MNASQFKQKLFAIHAQLGELQTKHGYAIDNTYLIKHEKQPDPETLGMVIGKLQELIGAECLQTPERSEDV